MKRKTIIIILCFIFACFTGCKSNESQPKPKEPIMEQIIKIKQFENSYNIYVSKDKGNDANSGSNENPLKNINEAIELASSKSALENTKYDSVKVIILDNVYELDKTINITKTFHENMPLVITGNGNNRPIISAGKNIKGGFTQYKDGIYKKNIDIDFNFRQLYVNDDYAIRARYPDYSDKPVECVRTGYWLDEAKEVEFSIPDEIAEKLMSDVGNLEMFALEEWMQGIGKVTGMAGFENIYMLKLTKENEKHFFSSRSGKTRPNLCLENHLELLDAENEWYYDAVTKDLYYKPAEGININDLTFTIPVLDELITVHGTSENIVENIRFENVQIAYSNWARPSISGLHGGQANHFSDAQGWGIIPPAIDIMYAKNIEFHKTKINNLGAQGIRLNKGAQHIFFKANLIENIAATAVRIDHFDGNMPLLGDLVHHVYFEDNIFNRIGNSYKDSLGILTGYCHDIYIQNNEMHDISYSAISAGWGWGGGPADIVENIFIKHNYIYNVVNNLLFDGAEIYCLGKHKKGSISEVSENYLKSGGGLASLYFDEGSTDWKSENNVIEGLGKVGYVHIHDVNYILRDVVVNHNFVIRKVESLRSWTPTGVPAIPARERNVVIKNAQVKKVRGMMRQKLL